MGVQQRDLILVRKLLCYVMVYTSCIGNALVVVIVIVIVDAPLSVFVHDNHHPIGVKLLLAFLRGHVHTTIRTDRYVRCTISHTGTYMHAYCYYV